MKKIKILITAIILLISGILIFYFRFQSLSNSFFAHFFYIPVIITAFWWQYRVIFAVFYISLALLASDFFSGNSNLILKDIIHSFSFFIVGLTVSYLRNIQINQTHLRIYRDILFSIQEAVVIIDRSFNFVLTNDSFNRVFSVQKQKLDSIDLLLNNDMKMQEFRETALRSFCGESVFMGVYIHDEISEGSYYLVNFYPLKTEAGINNLILSFRDISEQKRNEEMQIRSLERQKISIEVLELINSRKTDYDLINNILSLIRGKTGIDALVINLKPEEQFYKFASMNLLEKLTGYNVGIAEPGEPVKPAIPGFDESFCRKLSGNSFFWTNNLAEHCNRSGIDLTGSPVIDNFLSCAIIPLKNENDVIGYFMLLDRRENFFTNDLVVFYMGIGESIEIALSRIMYELNLKNMIHEKELLLKEVHHRVKNNMQVIISLISLQASRQSDEKLRDILNECQNRVRTMALVHEKLYSSDNFTSINMNAYIKSLVPMLLTSYRVDKTSITIEIDAPDIFFGLNTAVPLAQLINEVLSNVFKHAFKKSDSGSVRISLLPDLTEKNRYILAVSDSGCGLSQGIAFPQGGKLGFQLIDALSRQLKGKINFSGDNGVTVEVRFGEN